MKLLLICVSISIAVCAAPPWFFKVECNENEVIGYGMSSSLSLAKKDAIADITQSISVNVESSMEIMMSDDNGKAQKHAVNNLKAQSKVILNGVHFIAIEEEDDIWYVAAKYDNAPIEIKLRKLLIGINQEELQNSYLKNTPLINTFNNEMKKALDYKIIRKDNLWQLQYNDVILPLSQNEFYKLFSNQENQAVSIKANKYKYKDGDKMYFDIKHLDKGYISILYVEHNGKVGVLSKNIYSTGKLRYPKAQSEDVFEIHNPYNVAINELYIAVYSQEPIRFYEFENVTENVMDESNYNFDKLIKKLNKLTFSTYKIKISK